MEISLLSIFSLSATLDKIAAWSHTWTIGPYGIQKSILKEALRASPTAKQNAFTWFRISLNLTHQLEILHSYMVNQSVTQSEVMLRRKFQEPDTGRSSGRCTTNGGSFLKSLLQNYVHRKFAMKYPFLHQICCLCCKVRICDRVRATVKRPKWTTSRWLLNS